MVLFFLFGQNLQVNGRLGLCSPVEGKGRRFLLSVWPLAVTAHAVKLEALQSLHGAQLHETKLMLFASSMFRSRLVSQVGTYVLKNVKKQLWSHL